MLAFGDSEGPMSSSSTRPPEPVANAVRAVVDHEIDEHAPAEQVASLGAGVVESLCRHLAALVGDTGIAAVLDRAIKHVARELGWTATPAPPRRWEGQLEPIRDHLRRMDAPAARSALLALLGAFVAMVCTFIGDTLTLRLIQDVWPEAFT